MRLLTSILAIFVLAITSGCIGSGKTAELYGHVSEESDRLIRQLDSTFNAVPNGYLLDSIAKRLKSIAKESDPQSMARAYYAEGRIERAKRDFHKADSLLNLARLATDSVRFPYEYFLTMVNSPAAEGQIALHFLTLEHASEYFISAGDSTNAALTLNYIAAYRQETGDYAAADSLFRMVCRYLNPTSDAKTFALFTTTHNMGLNLILMGREKEGMEILDSLRQHTKLRCLNPKVNFWILNYSAKLHSNPLYLKEALMEIPVNEQTEWLRPLALSGIMDLHFEKGENDSVVKYGRTLERVMSSDMRHYDEMLNSYANYLTLIGDTARLSIAKSELRGLKTQMQKEKERLQMEKAASRTALESLRKAYNSKRLSERNKKIGYTTTIIIIVGALVMAIIRLRRNHSEARRQLESDLRDCNRQLATHTLRSAERERLLSSLAETIKNPPTPIESGIASRLLSQIKSASASENDWERFILLFNDMEPAFGKRLRELHPNLTQGDLRLAALIKMGLETKHIARILGINPDSVKKNRQRLRAKLGIDAKMGLPEYFETIESPAVRPPKGEA